MDRLLRVVFGRLVRAGNLRVTTAAGSIFNFGDGTGTPAAIRFTTRAAERGILLDPALKFGEAYMDGGVVVEQGSIADVLAIVLGQRRRDLPAWAGLRWVIRYLCRRAQQFNPRGRARRNVAHHYDLDGQLYGLFLDPNANIAAPISRLPVNRSMMPSLRRSVTLRRSFSYQPVVACSTSAAVGAALDSTSPNSVARVSPA
jgi:cyclopropane-fatty-acyl-phospholipid synthase